MTPMQGTVAILLTFFLVPPAAFAQPGKKGGREKGVEVREERGAKEREKDNGAQVSVSLVFSTGDAQIIREHFAHPGNLPPGLAKRGGDLPPGLRRHLVRDGTLPPGLQKRLVPFPEALERKLSPLPSGHLRVVLGRDALIIDAKTHRILDILTDAH